MQPPMPTWDATNINIMNRRRNEKCATLATCSMVQLLRSRGPPQDGLWRFIPSPTRAIPRTAPPIPEAGSSVG
jgi:hypothetical protein